MGKFRSWEPTGTCSTAKHKSTGRIWGRGPRLLLGPCTNMPSVVWVECLNVLAWELCNLSGPVQNENAHKLRISRQQQQRLNQVQGPSKCWSCAAVQVTDSWGQPCVLAWWGRKAICVWAEALGAAVVRPALGRTAQRMTSEALPVLRVSFYQLKTPGGFVDAVIRSTQTSQPKRQSKGSSWLMSDNPITGPSL